MKRLFFVVLTFFFACHASFAHAFETSAKYAIVMDYETGTVLYEKNASEPMTPSSMTKLMTTYLLFERLQNKVLKLEDTFTVSEKAWRMGGSKMFVRVGDQVTIEDLLKGIIIQSGNDACVTAAENISSSEDAFAQLMTETGEKLGLLNSRFLNSTGWPAEGHHMTARDIAVLSRMIIRQFPEYYHYFSEHEYTYNKIRQHNRNLLLYRNIGVDGLKTGHTEEVGYGIAVSGKQGDKRLVVVVNGLTSDQERANEAERLLNYGFQSFETKTMLHVGQEIEQAEVYNGVKPLASLAPGADLVMTVPKMMDDKIQVQITYNTPLVAPIAKGTEVGKIVITVPNMDSATVPLVAGEDIAEAGWFSRVIRNAKHYLGGE